VRDVHNLADLVRQSATSGSSDPALRWHDTSVTWGQLDAQVETVAGGLSAVLAARQESSRQPPGADPGGSEPVGGEPGAAAALAAPRVAIALPNSAAFAVAFFGALRAGFVAVPINPGYTGRELRYVLADSGAALLIATPAVFEALEAPGIDGADPPEVLRFSIGAPGRDTRPFTDLLAGAGDGTATRAGSRTTPDAPTGDDTRAGGDDLAVLLYTSGTAGMPKGAMLSHRALLANHEQLAELKPPPVGPDDVLLLTVPLFHAYGLNSGLCAIAYHGACGVLAERFDPADALDLIARHGVTAVIGVPPMVIAWSLMGEAVAGAFAGVRTVVSGAAPLDAAAARRFSAATGRKVDVGYGLTETAPVLTSTLASPYPKPGSIGRPIPGVELRLVDASGADVSLTDDDDDDDSPGTPGTPGTDPGEIVVRGANLFSGYWPDGKGGPGDGGWWATGDVAYADADGDLFLVDRLGELIGVSGFNVYPHEVETVLRAHPAVADAAALGVPHPYTGQTVKAYVVRKEGAEVTGEEIITFAERNLARFKCPTAVEFVAALPYSATGKIRKAALRSGVS
jgi:long-chain acyl-CoA synthetase